MIVKEERRSKIISCDSSLKTVWSGWHYKSFPNRIDAKQTIEGVEVNISVYANNSISGEVSGFKNKSIVIIENNKTLSPSGINILANTVLEISQTLETLTCKEECNEDDLCS